MRVIVNVAEVLQTHPDWLLHKHSHARQKRNSHIREKRNSNARQKKTYLTKVDPSSTKKQICIHEYSRLGFIESVLERGWKVQHISRSLATVSAIFNSQHPYIQANGVIDSVVYFILAFVLFFFLPLLSRTVLQFVISETMSYTKTWASVLSRCITYHY